MRSWKSSTIGGLIDDGVITIHKDGNHGSNYPRIEDFGDDGFCFLTAKSLSDWRIDLDGSPRLSKRKASELKFGFVAPGDVLLSHNATVGRVAIVPENVGPAVIGTSLTQFRLDPERLLPRFLALYFSSREFQNELSFTMAQTTRNQVPITEQRRLRVRVPPMDVQRSIADAAFCLIEKIELNRRVNETLAAMAQAIFRDWFVEFGPVRRKLAGTTEPVEVMGGLALDPARAAELAALFSGGVDAEGVPAGWRASNLGAVAEAVGEGVAPSAIRPDTPYIGLEHMPRRSIGLDAWGTAAKVSSQKSRFQQGQILFGKLRPYFHKVGIAPTDGVCSTDIVVLDSRKAFDRALVASCVSSDAFVAFTNQASTGTKMPRTSWGQMKGYGLAIPDEPVRKAFAEIVGPMHEKIASSILENRALAETRDYLLPRLMSGEVRVSEAEQATAAALARAS